MIRKLLLSFLLVATAAFAAGTVQQVTQQVGTSNIWVTTFNWTGDAINGSVPLTAAQLPSVLQGFRIITVETTAGTPTPTNGYGLQIVDFSGVDLLGSAAAAVSSSSSQSFAASPSSAPLFGTFSLKITGQNVAGAVGSTLIYMAPLSQVMGLTPSAPSFPSQGANLFYASPNGSSGSPGFRAIAGADVPATNLAAGGNGGVTGLLPSANLATVQPAQGGTGQVTLLAALQALLSGSTQGPNTDKVQMSTGAPTTGNCAQFDSLKRVVDAGNPCSVTPAGSGPAQWYRSSMFSPYSGGFSNMPFVYQPDLNFTYTPGGSLTGGTKPSLTLTPCPLGLVTSGTYATAMYLSGGTGTAEIVVVNGGSCTSGAATGTVTLNSPGGGNIVNSHTGAWTLIDASGGIQQALNYLANCCTVGTVWLNPFASIPLYYTVSFPAGSYTVDGLGGASATIVRQEAYPNGDLFLINQTASNYYYLQNLRFANNTTAGQSTGSAVNNILARVTMDKISCFGGPICLTWDGATGSSITNFFMNAGSHTFAIVSLTAASSHQASTDCRMEGGQLFANNNSFAINDASGDGIDFSHIQGGGGNPAWMSMIPGGTQANGYYIANTNLNDFLIDGINGGNAALQILSAPTGSGTTGLTLNQMKINLYGTAPSTILITGGTGAGMGGPILLTNSILTGGTGASINISQVTPSWPISVAGISIINGNSSAAPNTPCVQINTSTNVMFNGNSVYSANCTWAVGSEGASNNIIISGNDLSGAAAPYTLDEGFGVVPVKAVLANNLGVDNVIGTVPDAATIVFPPNPNFTITGSGTTITQCTMTQVPKGQRGTVIATGGSLTVTATGVIGAAGTLTQNKLYNWLWDGTKVWFSY